MNLFNHFINLHLWRRMNLLSLSNSLQFWRRKNHFNHSNNFQLWIKETIFNNSTNFYSCIREKYLTNPSTITCKQSINMDVTSQNASRIVCYKSSYKCQASTYSNFLYTQYKKPPKDEVIIIITHT